MRLFDSIYFILLEAKYFQLLIYVLIELQGRPIFSIIEVYEGNEEEYHVPYVLLYYKDPELVGETSFLTLNSSELTIPPI